MLNFMMVWIIPGILFGIGVVISELAKNSKYWAMLGASLTMSFVFTVILLLSGYTMFWDLGHFIGLVGALYFTILVGDLMVGAAYKSKIKRIEVLEGRIWELENIKNDNCMSETTISALNKKIEKLEKNEGIEYFLPNI